MTPKPVAEASLKSLLMEFLGGRVAKMPKLTLEAKLGGQLQVSDSPAYFLAANELKKHLDKAEGKNASITLKNWRFVRNASKKAGGAAVGIEADEVQVRPLAAAPKFAKSGKDLLSLKEVRALLEGAPAARKPTGGQKAREDKKKKGERAKKLISPKKEKAKAKAKTEEEEEEQEGNDGAATSNKKKIAKSGQKSSNKQQKQEKKVQFAKADRSAKRPAKAGLKLKRTPFKVAEEEEPASSGKKESGRKAAGKGVKSVAKRLDAFFELEDPSLTPAELIQAPDFLPFNKKSSVTKTLKLTPSKKQQTTTLAKNREYLSLKQRTKLSELVSEVGSNNVLVRKNGVEELLHAKPLEIADILRGIKKGMIAWAEINFPISTLNYLPDPLESPK